MQKEQIRWQCRRGMLELDMILLKYLDTCFDTLSLFEQEQFIQLLKSPDQTLYQWLIGQQQPENPEMAAFIRCIRGVC